MRRLVSVYCHGDPAWTQQLLQATLGSVEELQLFYASEEHLLSAHAMPRLRRLYLMYCAIGEFPELPPLATPSGLQWLRVDGFPRATLLSLLRAHGASLRKLTLSVSEPGVLAWPNSCNDLDTLLAGCGLVRLELLVLRRLNIHTEAGCRFQREAVRRVLPAATVLCKECDVVNEDLVEF